MDRDFNAKIEKLNEKNKVVFSIGHNTFFSQVDNHVTVRYVGDSGEPVDHKLRNIEELVEGDTPFDSSDDDWMDSYLPLLMAIETAIDRVYKEDLNLKDKTIITVLERLIMKPDINLAGELSTTIQNHMKLILSTTPYSRKEVVGCLKKVQRSVKRHHAVDGPTGYLDFIKDKV